MKVEKIQSTGRRAKTGGICFVNNHLCVFVAYCPDCKGKVVCSLDEARDFANKYRTECERHTVKSILKKRVKLQIK